MSPSGVCRPQLLASTSAAALPIVTWRVTIAFLAPPLLSLLCMWPVLKLHLSLKTKHPSQVLQGPWSVPPVPTAAPCPVASCPIIPCHIPHVCLDSSPWQTLQNNVLTWQIFTLNAFRYSSPMRWHSWKTNQKFYSPRKTVTPVDTCIQSLASVLTVWLIPFLLSKYLLTSSL
jgi:hypothetical protein